MGFAYAGFYGPEAILDQTSKVVYGLSVTVYESNGTTVASLYTDETMATAAANPTTTDSLGNLLFFALPALYVLAFSLNGVATTRNVIVTPWVQEPAWGPGRIEDFAGTSIPKGFLATDGSAVSRTTYADLFAAVGTTWGAGDGSTTFNVPDLRGRSTIGDNGTGSNGQPSIAVGAVGGEASHVLVSGEMPSHNHSDAGHTHGVSDPGHNHVPSNANSFVTTAPSSTLWITASGAQAVTFVPGTDNAPTGVSVNSGAASIQSTGGSGAHNNLHPYAGVTKIVRY